MLLSSARRKPLFSEGRRGSLIRTLWDQTPFDLAVASPLASCWPLPTLPSILSDTSPCYHHCHSNTPVRASSGPRTRVLRVEPCTLGGIWTGCEEAHKWPEIVAKSLCACAGIFPGKRIHSFYQILKGQGDLKRLTVAVGENRAPQ